MDNEIELISDGDGLALIGKRADVDRFLANEGLLSVAMDLGLQKLGPALQVGAVAGKAGAEIAANSGRWLKLTKESAHLVDKFGLMETKTQGVSHAMIGQPGAIGSWLQVETGPMAFLTNPARLAGAAGVLAQLARQHELNEIKDYLARIDKKVDDVIRAQKDAEIGPLIGAGFDIESAAAVLERNNEVDDDTWSTVQGRTQTITDGLGWALRRLEALAEKLESESKVRGLAKTAKNAEPEVRELLTVVARCFELQDSLDVLRLNRALSWPAEKLDGLRLSLEADRTRRRQVVSGTIGQLMARMDAAAGTANANVLLHQIASRTTVGSVNRVAVAVDDFHKLLGVESARQATGPTRWLDAIRDREQLKNAATEARPVALGTVAFGVAAALAAVARDGEGGDEE